MPHLREDHYHHQILAACEQLHMNHTGASDTLTQDQRFVLIGWLKYRLSVWADSPPFTQQYDDAVRYLIMTTLDDEGAR